MAKYVDVTFDGKTPIKDLYDSMALEQAKAFPDLRVSNNQGRMVPNRNTTLSKSQIRRFFGEVKNLQIKHNQAADKESSWTQIKPVFKMIKSKASYASGTKKIPDEFKDFIINNISKVETKEEFEVFVNYFEAVLAYAYGENKIGN
jgi:CRISPR-associated protein Csm2